MEIENSQKEIVRGKSDGALLAFIIRMEDQPIGIRFITPPESDQQIGTMNWPNGHIVEAHVHNRILRSIDSTQEVLFVRSGRVRADLYNRDMQYECSKILSAGDVLVLVAGGHGFEILEKADIVEVKQGPYLGENEKTRFIPTDNPHFEPHDQ